MSVSVFATPNGKRSATSSMNHALAESMKSPQNRRATGTTFATPPRHPNSSSRSVAPSLSASARLPSIARASPGSKYSGESVAGKKGVVSPTGTARRSSSVFGNSPSRSPGMSLAASRAGRSSIYSGGQKKPAASVASGRNKSRTSTASASRRTSYTSNGTKIAGARTPTRANDGPPSQVFFTAPNSPSSPGLSLTSASASTVNQELMECRALQKKMKSRLSAISGTSDMEEEDIDDDL